MAIKKALVKKKEPISRSMRAPATVVDVTDQMVADAVGMAGDPADDFAQAPLTPEQQAEKDAMDGFNAAAEAGNGAIPERKELAKSARALKALGLRQEGMREFMALPKEERDRLIDQEQVELKEKYKKYKK